MKMLSDFYELSLDELMDQESKGASGLQIKVTETGEEQEDLEENLIVGGFIIGLGLGLVTGNFLLGTAGGFIGLGLPYIIRAIKNQLIVRG